MRLVAISDIHGMLPDPNDCPDCDVLVIAGDICPDGDETAQYIWLDIEFRAWLEALNTTTVGIAGNHDFVFEDEKLILDLKLPWTYLQDSVTEHDGMKFYGIPWVPLLRGWAFYKNDTDLEASFAKIPLDTDVIISHGPIWGIGDRTIGGVFAGSMAALSAYIRVRPEAFICGHIHEGRGVYAGYNPRDFDGWAGNVYNVASVNEFYVPHEHRFIEIDLDRDLKSDALAEEQELTDITSQVPSASAGEGHDGQQPERSESSSS
jgi:Icc-related predicted phosphoesterase